MNRRARWILLPALIATAAGAAQRPPAESRVLRVCADPNNLPFSNEKQEGFENRLAALVARDLKARLEYVWWAQRRGFIRNTLAAGACDVVFGVPSRFDRVLPTAPYLRSSYVFVSAGTIAPAITSLDDPRLRTLRIGVHLIGDDYTNTPPAHALARRGIVRNVAGYTIYGDYREPNPPARIIEALGRGEIDVAIVWGPFAGYFAPRERTRLRITPVSPASDGPAIPFQFDISLGVRLGNDSLRSELDAVLARRKSEIHAILAEYGVPMIAAGAQR
ncbi:MAG TPA: substrate-binding domain-containing protein [Gemmatimonadales bacterium]|nr:substrate-binding domain-containing protein [Gemmatimonadales bacterium]